MEAEPFPHNQLIFKTESSSCSKKDRIKITWNAKNEVGIKKLFQN